MAGVSHEALKQTLSKLTRSAALVERRADGLLACTACAHGCVLGPGRHGACGVRFNLAGELRVPYGYVARKYVRPIETNTLYHVLPGRRALTFGMLGCDLRCPYCHNFKVSQALRERLDPGPLIETSPRALVDEAIAAGCAAVCAAYNEPMLAAEWVHAVFAEAKTRGLLTALITDGNATRAAIDFIRPVTDVYRVDLKASTVEQYHTLGGRLGPVLDAIAYAKRVGLWVEVVTLVVPGFNDDAASLRRCADALFAIDPCLPWHLNAMMPRYKLRGRAPTPALSLFSAVGAAFVRGLRFVYASNLPSLTELGHTRCERCREVLVERVDYRTLTLRLVDGRCPTCEHALPGIWS
jgi:pyruvate formate lyase activating enzyme